MKKRRVDGQITALAGEFFVAAEMLKRGIQTFLTFGNAKSIDLLAYDPDSGFTFTVQVKSLRSKNYFLMDPEKIERQHIYIFVVLNAPSKPVEYFVVSGSELISEVSRFAQHPKLPGIHPRKMEDWRDKWIVFQTKTTISYH